MVIQSLFAFRKLGFPALLKLSAILFFLWSGFAAKAGLTGEYFDNADFTSKELTRTDVVVDFDWGTGSPDASLSADTFSVRWSGQIEPPISETYTFCVTADEGARLWVNDHLIANRTIPGSGTVEISGSLPLLAGRRYNLVLEFEERTGPANVRLEWSSQSQPRQVIPQERLYPATALPQTGGVLMEFWSGIAGTNIATLTNDARFPNQPNGREFPITFECLTTNWADNYGTRVTGFLAPLTNGLYRLAVSASDTAQLYFSANTNPANKQLVASVPAATAFREFSRFTNQLSPLLSLSSTQRCYIELLNKAGTGSDHFSVAWQPPDATNFSIIPAEALVPAGLDRAPPAQAQMLATLTAGHPRLLASEAKFVWLKQTLALGVTPQLNTWWNSVRSSADTILTQAPNIYDPDVRGTILGVSRSVLDRVGKLALAWRMTGDTNYAERAWIELEAAANFPDWHPAHFLDTAEMTHAFALGYDWLHDYWSPTRHPVITNALVAKGLNQGLTQYRNNASFFRSTANNWNLVCNGGMVLGALALGEEAPALTQEILSRAIASAGPVMRHWTTDNGGWYEGPGYWGYTTEYNTRLLAALESALGSDFGLSSIPALSEAGLFATHMVGPSAKSFNFADASSGQIRAAHLFWLARRYNRPLYAWHERTYGSASPMDLLWFDPRGESPLDAGLPAGNWFRGLSGTTSFNPADAVTLRTDWQGTSASFVGFKTGQIGDSHGNLDAGGFVFDALGVRWAHDLGGDDYALPGYFGSERWTYYRLRAEGHNTLVIDPGSGADQVVGAKPPILLYQDHPQEALVVADLTSAYGASRVWRGLRLFEDRRWLLVQDEIQASSPATVWWFMHFNTASAATITPDGSAALLTQGASRLWVKVLSGGGTFGLSNAVPLPTSPNPAGQNTNGSYKKLALKLTNVTNTQLAVLLVPLRSGENPPAILPTLQPLALWSTPTAIQPPLVGSTTLATWDQTPVDVDLRSLVRDPSVDPAGLGFTVLSPTNGMVALLSDAHTARFTAATNFSGLASFTVAASKAGPPASALLYYDFEPPEETSDGGITDHSTRWLDGGLTKIGTGDHLLTTDRPAALAAQSSQSLRLVENGDNHSARLTGAASPGDYDFNQRDWTFSGWFKRATTTNDDFLFYLGSSDGFGSPDELQLFCPANKTTLALQHYTGQSATDADLSFAGVSANQWRHVAVVFDSTNGSSGTISLYVDGVLRGTDNAVALNLPPGSSAIFGGHASDTFQTRRWFNGWLDDVAVFTEALAAAEVVRLATQPIGRIANRAETNRVQVLVNRRNRPPELAVPVNQTLISGQVLVVTNTATDSDLPAAPLRFALISGPDSASLDPNSGLLTWQPTLAQAGSNYTFTVTVADTGSVAVLPPLADATVKIEATHHNFGFGATLSLANENGIAARTNEAWLRFDLHDLATPIDRATLRLTPLSVNNASTHLLYWVTDDDWQEDTLTASNAPIASSLMASWTPREGLPVEIQPTAVVAQEAAGDRQVSFRIRANQARPENSAEYAARECGMRDFPQLHLALAPLVATQSFNVVVQAPRSPTVRAATLAHGQLQLTIEGDAGLRYAVLVSSNLLTWETLLETNPAVLPFQIGLPVEMHRPRQFYRVLLAP